MTFLLGTRPDRLTRTGTQSSLEVGGRTLHADRVVSTIPVDHALDLIGTRPEAPLPSVNLVSRFTTVSGQRCFADPIPYNDGAWKRLTVYSDCHGRVGGREYLTAEVIGGRVGDSVDRAAADFQVHTAANGVLLGHLRFEGGHALGHAYPIYTAGAGERSQRKVAALRRFGIESFGRQGGFQHQPTARVSTVEAERALGAR